MPYPAFRSIFAVRQWPGNLADLDFEPVVKNCNNFLLSSKHMQEVADLDKDGPLAEGDDSSVANNRRLKASEELMQEQLPMVFSECAFFRIWVLLLWLDQLRPVSKLLSLLVLRDCRGC